MNPKIIFVCNTAGILTRFRMPLIKEVKKKGYEVTCICGGGFNYQESLDILNKEKIKFYHFPGLENDTIAIGQLIKNILNIKSVINRENPDIIHSFTHRANVVTFFALLGNRKVRFIPNVTGAGRLFTDQLHLREKIIRYILLKIYKRILVRSECMYFQNSDDVFDFAKALKSKNNKFKLTNGSGVDPSDRSLEIKISKIDYRKHLYEKYKINPYKKLFLLPTRALKSKGVVEFYEAAKRYLEMYDDAVFVHAGEPINHTLYGLNSEMLEKMQSTSIHYIGFQTNISSLMFSSDIIVLPSYYREGVPRALLEALYFGKLIITTDAPGCRDTVIDKWNGILVSRRSVQSLLSAMINCKYFDFDQVHINSRLLFNSFFHSEKIVDTYLREYENKSQNKKF